MSDYLKPQWDKEVIEVPLKKRKRWNSGDILPDNEIMMAIVGSTGSGKTMILAQILPHVCPSFLKYVIVCSRIEGGDGMVIYKAIENWCNKTDKQYVFCGDIDQAYDTIENIINTKKDTEHVVIIMDDWNEGCVTQRSNAYAKMTNELFSKMRNFQCNMFFVVQSYTAIPTICRANINCVVVFKMKDQYALRSLSHDWQTLTDTDENSFYSLHRMISQEKHSYFIGTDKGVWIFIYGKMDRITKVEFSK